MKSVSLRFPAVAYAAPFGVYILLLGLRGYLPVPAVYEYPLRAAITLAALLAVSPGALSFQVSRLWPSAALGVLVFGIWVGPDIVWPRYREHWLFQNFLVQAGAVTWPADFRDHYVLLALRALGSALLVPVIEELFWRGWLMRWLIRTDFLAAPLGAYSPASFWITAALFASEHGPYWDVGLAAGILYNWWVVRTRSLGDCILAHAVTNACLAVYVVGAGQYQYWL